MGQSLMQPNKDLAGSHTDPLDEPLWLRRARHDPSTGHLTIPLLVGDGQLLGVIDHKQRKRRPRPDQIQTKGSYSGAD